MTSAELRKGRKRQLSPSVEAERNVKVLRISCARECQCHRCLLQHILARSQDHGMNVADLATTRRLMNEINRNVTSFKIRTCSTPMTKTPIRQLNGEYQPYRPNELIFNPRKTISSNFKTLKEEMDALQVVRILKQKGVVDEDFFKKLKDKKTRREKVEAFLIELDQLLLTRPVQVYPAFIKALEESDQDDLVTALRAPPQTPKLIMRRTDANVMYRFFTKAKDKIIETVEPRRFIDDAVMAHGIDLQEYADIIKKENREGRARELLKIIPHAPPTVIKLMCDCYDDLFKQFKNSEISSTADINQIGTPLALRFNFRDTVAQEDNNEHSDPLTEIKKLQQRLVDTTNDNPAEYERLQEQISNDARLLLSRLSLSSVKLHLKTTTATSLEDLKECCRNGKAIAWIMSLLQPGDIEKLKELEVTRGKLECYIDDEDPKMWLFEEAFRECFCLLKRDTLQSNFGLFQSEFDGFEAPIIDELLESKALDKTLEKHLLRFKAITTEQAAEHVLAEFLLQENVPQICFCIIDKILIRNMSSPIKQLRENLSHSSDLQSEDTIMIVKKNLKDNIDLLEEELDARWFLAPLKSRTGDKYLQIIMEIEKSRSRKSRTKPFVKFLCKEDDLEWFVMELEECSPHVLAVLSRRKNLAEAAVFRNAMLSVYDFIIEEVETLELKSHVGAACLEQLQFEDIEKISGRKERALFLMKQLFKEKNLDRVIDIMDAFSSKYTNIEKAIRNVSRNGSTCAHYKCPRIEKHKMKMSKYIFTDEFNLPGLEKKDFKREYEQVLQEMIPKEITVVHSNDGCLSKDLLQKENADKPLNEQAVETKGEVYLEKIVTPLSMVMMTLEVPGEMIPECPLSVSLQLSETKHAPCKDIDAVSKTCAGIDKEERDKKMNIDDTEECVKAGNMNATPKEISFCKANDKIKLEETIKTCICGEIELEVMNSGAKDNAVESVTALASTQFVGKQLTYERPPVKNEEQYENKDDKEESLTITEEKPCFDLSKNTSGIQKEPITSENITVQNEAVAKIDLQECNDVKVEEWRLKQTINTAVDLNTKPVQPIMLQPHSTSSLKTTCAVLDNNFGNTLSRNSRNPASASSLRSVESANGSQSNDARSSAMITMKRNSICGNKGQYMSHYSKPSTSKLIGRFSPKQIVNRKSNEVSSSRDERSVSYCNNYHRSYGYYGRQNIYMTYREESERNRRREWEYYWYCYNYWLRYCMWLDQSYGPNPRRKNTPHHRGHTYPPTWNQQNHYDTTYSLRY